MTKKGMSWFVWIILGLAVIIIVASFISTQGPKGWKSISDLIGFKQEQVPGSSVGEGPPAIRLNTKSETIDELVKLLKSCWDKNTGARCGSVLIPKGVSITKKELVDSLKKQSSAAAEQLSEGWKETPKGNLVGGTVYYVCLDYDWPSSNDLYISTDPGFCEKY